MSASKLSREEVEGLCIVHCVAQGACTARELAQRLGLGPSLEAAVADAAMGFVNTGWLAQNGDEFAVTDRGTTWFDRVMARLPYAPRE